MKHLTRIFIVCLVISVFTTACSKKEAPRITYPVTQKVDHVDDYHGTQVSDPYRWLEDMNSPETAKWVEAQKKVTEQYLSAIEIRSRIKARLIELWNYERYSTPSKEGDYYVFTKNDGLQEQSVVYLQEGLTGKPEVLLDPNTFSKDGSISLRTRKLSRDYKYLGYGISRGGSDWREFFVMEVKTRKKLSDHINWVKFSGLSWYKNGFFYSRFDKPKESEKFKAKIQDQKIYYHQLDTPQSRDKLIFQDKKNPKRGYYTRVTDNEKYMAITVWEGAANHNYLYYKKLGTDPDSPMTPLIDKPLGYFSFVEEINDAFLVSTDYEAPNYKLILIDVKKPGKENWKTIIPESTDKLQSVSCVGGRLIASYLKDANTRVSVFDLEGKKIGDVQLPGIGTARGFSGKKEDDEVFYSFSSFTVPSTIYRYNVKENRSFLFREPAVKFNPDDFETKQVFYESKDNTKVPLFIIYKKGIKLTGQNPAMLYGYGGFNSTIRPRFNLSIIPLLEHGGIYAVACLRGGGEYGEKWHRAGMLGNKQNVFDDFIAAAEYLVRSGYTSPGRLAIRGTSNGGLLVGAVMNQRPDLFKVAIPQVGVMDMLRFHKFTIGWAWVGEYGSSENPGQFQFLYKYSPLHNIKEGLDYPATLVTTADHDDRVFPAHSFKYIATLQEKYKGTNPVLIRIETKVGHGGGTSTSKSIDLYTDIYSFMLYNMNIKPGT
ncbi:MAG: prolyl oligopeptidase family serine peptidase [Candidatus Aminicenantes bacterium]|nr:prolyl oligopeptidase family serine peptidase [Candidatus Aminicenantes bacterium]NIM80030.1 prolyl oligopeptidase family serine peptidase [Candidatus Aminicenantes bacterium]NIN18291.1 prolyl oligopeptidase family serine peptidase [Candidatus Aminicenantes bacterium]NIN42188.1 prolyl oligopeptidase family serine peptidase [Candidatus Aminicenantes bacterium]NIN84944.1 prolyl oligopeptidase family serine peptidase [Candidatus Aminicenantes bacterium]